jgi:hypothetical protein
MSSAEQLLDAAGRRRSPATMPEPHAGRAPGNKGQRYAADPPAVDEIIAVMRHAGHARYGNRLNGLIVVLWRAGLRINEALSLTETDLEERRGRSWSGMARMIAAARPTAPRLASSTDTDSAPGRTELHDPGNACRGTRAPAHASRAGWRTG